MGASQGQAATWILLGAGLAVGCCCLLGLYHAQRCIGKSKHTSHDQGDVDSEGGGREAEKEEDAAPEGAASTAGSQEEEDVQVHWDEEDWGLI